MTRICLLFLLLFLAERVLALPNPASIYCEKMGYAYKILKTPGGEKGVVVVKPGVEFDAWDFFKGKVGQEYSFGALAGYETQCVRTNLGSCVVEYAVCIPRAKQALPGGIPVSQEQIMEQKGVPLFDDAVINRKKNTGVMEPQYEREEKTLDIYRVMGQNRAVPTAFDWRTNNAHAYIGSIRDQGDCGSCYSFAAAAAAECTYNWAKGMYDDNCVDFSESYIIWCLGRLSQYSPHFFGCDGADYDYAELTAITTEGICLESYFPYTETDPGSCTHWSDPVTVFGSWHRVDCGDIAAIKTAIMTYGAVDAAVYVDSGFNAYTSGIYSNSSTNCYSSPCYYTPVNHAIALVGWDDNPPEGGGGCWILRNSWGPSWGENGYMRIRYNAARVACEATYLVYLGTNTHTLSISSVYGGAYPPPGVITNNHGTTFDCYVTNSPIINGTTQLTCIGWIGTGSVPVTGNTTNTGTFTLTNDSSLVWQWRTNFYLRITTNGNGTVDVPPGWKMLGSNLVLTATPASSWSFSSWSGDTGACTVESNMISFVMRGARSITANFSSNTYETISACVCADYDGDAKADPAVFDEAAGNWRIKLSGSGYYLIITAFSGVGGVGCASVSADYDGDAKADPAFYEENTGLWTILKSSANYAVWVFPQTLGGSGYSGMPADYDGDNKADPCVYQRERGDWRILLSSAGYSPVDLSGFLGGAGYRAAAADYDGDYKGDPAVYGESNGLWLFKISSADYLMLALAQSLGGTGFIPVPADYDGDAKADPAVKSASSNEWIVMFSSSGYTPVHLVIQFE
jgi:C1A family cysteine protease